MTGYNISLLCILILKDALEATVTSSEFKYLKVFEKIAYYFLQDEFWKYLFMMFRDVYTTTHFICLTDHKIPPMEKFYYFILQNKRMFPKQLKDAEDWSKRLLMDDVKKILEFTRDAESIVVDSEEEDDEKGEELSIHQ